MAKRVLTGAKDAGTVAAFMLAMGYLLVDTTIRDKQRRRRQRRR